MIDRPNENASMSAGVNVDSAGGLDATKGIPKSFANSIDAVNGTQEPITSIPELEIAPEFESLIPPLQPEERAQLEANILAEGCRDPLVLWDEVLLDGHNRYAICTKHGIQFQTVQAHGIETLDDAILWIVNNQLGRRNITDFVRGELALRAKPIVEARARARQEATQIRDGSTVRPNSDAPCGRTDDAIAAQAGMGRDNLRKVEKIQATAVPEVLAAVRAGEISINTAAKVAVLPVEEQAAIAAAGPAGIKEAVAKAAPAPKASNEELQRLREENAELRERVAALEDELKSTLADNEMMGRAFDADDRLKATMDEAIRQKAIADNAERSFNAQQGKVIGLSRNVTYWQNRAEKAEKSLAKVGA